MWPPRVGINYSLFFSPITSFLATFGREKRVASFKSSCVYFGFLCLSCYFLNCRLDSMATTIFLSLSLLFFSPLTHTHFPCFPRIDLLPPGILFSSLMFFFISSQIIFLLIFIGLYFSKIGIYFVSWLNSTLPSFNLEMMHITLLIYWTLFTSFSILNCSFWLLLKEVKN